MRVSFDQIFKIFTDEKFLLFALSVAGVLFITAQSKTIYSYKVEGLTGDEIDFSKFKGKRFLL